MKALQSSERLVLIHSPIIPSDCSLTKSGQWPLIRHTLLISMCINAQSSYEHTRTTLFMRHVQLYYLYFCLQFGLCAKWYSLQFFLLVKPKDSLTSWCYLEFHLQLTGESVRSFYGHTHSSNVDGIMISCSWAKTWYGTVNEHISVYSAFPCCSVLYEKSLYSTSKIFFNKRWAEINE